MEKDKILTIIIAGLLALALAIGFYIKNYKETLPNLPQEETILDNRTDTSEEVSIEESETAPSLDPIPEEEAKKDIKSMREKTKTTPKTTIKSDNETQAPIKKADIVENAEAINKDAGIIKEQDSNVIVITQEFKMQSPAKYSFK